MVRGGKRKGAGRKRHNPPLKRVGAYLTVEQAKVLRMWGKGDLSAGIRWLINSAIPLVTKAEYNQLVITPPDSPSEVPSPSPRPPPA